MGARRHVSGASDLDRLIDEVLGRAVRRIEAERKVAAYRGANPEAGVTRTEQLLVDAMLGKTTLDDLAAAVR